MPRVLTRYDDSLDVSNSGGDSSSNIEIDLLNLRPEDKSRQRVNERFSKLFPARSIASSETALTKLPLDQGGSCNLENRQNLRYRNIHNSDLKSRRDGGTPRIIRAIRRHSEKLNIKYCTESSSFRGLQEENSKSSVVVLYDGKSSKDGSTDSSSYFSSSSSSCFSSKAPVRASKSEKTLVTVALPVEISSIDKRSVTFDVNTSNNLSRSPETPEKNSPCSRGDHFRRRKLTRYRHCEPSSTRGKGRKRSVRSKTRLADKRVASSGSFERERRTYGKERCGANERFSRCLMAHRYTSSRQIVTREKNDQKPEPETIRNPRVAFLMQHIQNNQHEAAKRGDAKTDFNEASNGDQRVFPFQSTASGNLKIIPDQVVFESKKVSVLVADPHHTRVNVKAELGRSDVTRPEFGAVSRPGNNEPSDFSGKNNQSEFPSTVINNGYVPRTQPFKSSQNISSGEMEENHAKEGILQRLPLPANEVPLSSLGFTGEQPIDWQNIILPEKTDLYRELARRITNYKNADCIVRLGHDEFHCHLLVLQSYSTYFDEKNYKEVDLTDSNVTSKAFSIIYDWMISPTNESCHLLRRDNILEIFMAAHELGIKELEEQCWAFIDNDELFTEDTAFLLYLEARKIGNTAVMELMVPRIMKFFLMLVGTKDFLELLVDELCLLLRSNYICVNSEMEVLMSAVRWLMHDWQSRRQHMIQVLKCIRFGLIAPWQLIDVKRNPENPEFMELMSYPEVQKMVDDGLAFVIIKYWYGNQTEDYYHWIDLLGLTEPTNRNWAGEDKNYVTYREFLLYLEEYQRTKMPELKSRKSPAGKAKNDGAAGPSSLSRKPEAGVAESTAPLEGGTGHMAPLPHATSGNLGRSDKYPRMPGSSLMAGQPPAPPPGATGIPMPPELLGRYLSTFERNAKATTSRNSRERRSNIEAEENTRRVPTVRGTNRRPWEARVKNLTSSKHETIVKHGDHTHEDSRGGYRECNEAGDSSKSEEDAATTIQAIYRGYKARSKYHEIRKSCSEERLRTRKIAELLGTTGFPRDNMPKPLEPIRLSVSQAGRDKNDQRESKIPRRSPSPRKKRMNSFYDDQTTVKDLEGLRLGVPRAEPVPDEQIRQKDTEDSIRTIHRTGIFNNFDEKTTSLSQSENTDTEADTFSPRTNGSIRVRNENLPLRISESIIGGKGSNDYHGKDSLFFPNSEAIIVFGGLDPHQDFGVDGNTAKDMYRFKSLENEWEYVGEIPEPRHHHSCVYLRGRVYLVGGADPRNENTPSKDLVVGNVWSYDPTTRVWFTEANLLTPRKDFGLVVSDGKMYAIGGQDRSGVALRSVEAYDPSSREWREMRPMNTARIGPAAAKYRELIWVGGGMTKSKKEPLTREVECYDPLNDRWLRAEPLRSPRCFASMYVIGDCLYVIGGAAKTSINNENGGITESIESIDYWDRNSLVWRQHGEIGIARHGLTVGSIGDQMLVIGGLTTVYMQSLRSVECYCCQTGKIIKGASSLPYPLAGHDSVSLPAANFLTSI